MKVEQIMKTSVKTITADEPVENVARMMVLSRIAGVPVVEDGVVIGMVSEKDILRSMYPSYQDFVDSPVGNMNFEEMEERYKEVRCIKVSEIMSKKMITARPDTPILKASSLMILNKVRRLPVVEADGKLVGIVSQGDIHMAVFEKHVLDFIAYSKAV